MIQSEEKQSLDIKSLPERQRLFIKYYLATKNASEACRLSGYSKRNAADTGHRLLNDPKIRRYIEEKSDWTFEEWCDKVKGVYLQHGDNWQASLKSLELYGKGKGFCRDSGITINQLSVSQDDIVRLRKTLQSKGLQLDQQPVDSLSVSCEQVSSASVSPVDNLCKDGGGQGAGGPPATPLDGHTTTPKNAQENKES